MKQKRAKNPLPLERRKKVEVRDDQTIVQPFIGCMLPLIASSNKLVRLQETNVRLTQPYVQLVATVRADQLMRPLKSSPCIVTDQYCSAAFFIHQNPTFRRFELEFAPRQNHGNLTDACAECKTALEEAKKENLNWMMQNVDGFAKAYEEVQRSQHVIDTYGDNRSLQRQEQVRRARKTIKSSKKWIEVVKRKVSHQLPYPISHLHERLDIVSIQTLTRRFEQAESKLSEADWELWDEDNSQLNKLLLAYLQTECGINVPETNALRPFVHAMKGTGKRGAVYDLRDVKGMPTDEFGWPADASMDPMIIDFPDIRTAFNQPSVLHQDKERAAVGYFEQAETDAGVGNGFFGIQRGDRAELVIIDWKTAFGLFASAEYYAEQGILDAILSAATP
ncbi:MAG: hypothetical protein WC477_04140 [Patescibacteria group bacterium]